MPARRVSSAHVLALDLTHLTSATRLGFARSVDDHELGEKRACKLVLRGVPPRIIRLLEVTDLSVVLHIAD